MALVLTANEARSFYRWINLDESGTGYESASQSFKAGDILIREAAGTVAIGAASGSNITNAAIIYGVALEDASGVTNNPVRVGVFRDKSRLVLPVMHTTAASAITAYTDADQTYVIKNDATYGWCLLLSTTTNGCAKWVEHYAGFPIGTQYGPVLVQIPAFVDTDVTISRVE